MMFYRIDTAGTSSSGGAVMEKSLSLLGAFGRVFVGDGSSINARTTTLLALLTAVLSMTGSGLMSTTSALAAETCPNEAVREEQHTDLSDCRAYEVVTPQQKNGADVTGYPQRTRAAVDGSAVQFASSVGFGDVRGSGISFDYMGVRTGTPGTRGWSTHAITPGGLEALPFVDQFVTAGFDAIYRGEMSDDLSHGVFGTFAPLTAGSPNTANLMNLYMRSDLLSPGHGVYQMLTACPGCSGPLTGLASDQPELAGASADFSHVLFESTQNLTVDSVGLDPHVVKTYEWANGTVRLAGILPDGSPAPSSEAGPGALISSSVASLPATYTPNTISRDGSRIYFTHPVANLTAGRLYLRSENSTPSASTVQVNLAELTPSPTPLDDGRFWTATPDGSKVLFTTQDQLLATDTSSGSTDLYLYDVDKPEGHHLTLISAPDPGLSANVQGVVGISDDGHYVYFVSNQQLLSSGPGEPGISRIFVWHDGTIREIAAIADDDRIPIVGGGGWRGFPKTSRVTADGTRLVFMSKNTGGGASDDLPHSGVGDTCVTEGGCEEVYLFDATTSSPPVCVSCHRPDVPAQTPASIIAKLGNPATGSTNHLNHPLSANGRYVFFTTGDRLVLGDHDGSTVDVYEYDTATGQTHLLSGGKAGSLGSYFMDADANGHNTFFLTRDQLSRWDADDQVDLYDARVGGGMPEPKSPPIACAGDTCHGAQTNNPAFAPLSSVGFSGAGNLKPLLKKVTPLTKAQKLKKALKKCKTKRKKSLRKKCELSARKSFGRTK